MFMQDTGLFNKMPYIEVHQFTEGFAHANIEAI